MATAESNLKIVVTADDKTKSGLSGASKNLGLLNKNVTGLATAMGGAAIAVGGLAVAFGASAINSYGEAQASLAKVDAILNTMGATAKKNRDAILSAADAAVKLGFDDEAAAESITKFYQRTKDLTEATKLNNFAMDLARFKNIGLSEASQAVNMALGGNVRMLKELGIAVDETKTPLEQIAQAQKIVAGQAESFASTWPGQMAILQETWSNFKDGIGKTLVEALMPFVKQFNAWLNDPVTKKNFEHWTSEFQSWAEVIIPVVIDTFKMWASWLQVVYDTLLAIGEAITNIVNKAGKLGSTLKESFKNAGSNIKWALGLEGKATGGPVSGGTPYIVGERGPEIFMPNSSGSIIPNNKLSGAGGGITVNINGGYFLDQDVAEKIGDLIMGKLKLSNVI